MTTPPQDGAPAPRARRGHREPVRPLAPTQRLALLLGLTHGAALATGWIAAGSPETSFFTWALCIALGGSLLAGLCARPGDRCRRWAGWSRCAFAANASCAATRAGGELFTGSDLGSAVTHLALGVLFLLLAAGPLAAGRIYPAELVLSHALAGRAGGLQRGRPPRRVTLRLADGRAVPAVVKAGFHLTKIPRGVTAAMVVDVTAEPPRGRWRA